MQAGYQFAASGHVSDRFSLRAPGTEETQPESTLGSHLGKESCGRNLASACRGIHGSEQAWTSVGPPAYLRSRGSYTTRRTFLLPVMSKAGIESLRGGIAVMLCLLGPTESPKC